MEANGNTSGLETDGRASEFSPKKRPNLDDSAEPSKKASPKKSRMSRRLSEERHFYDMYGRVLEYIRENLAFDPDGQPWSDFDFYVHMAMDGIVDSFRWDQGHRFSDVDYSLYENICAYIFRYGTHGAGLTRYRVLEAADDCQGLRDVCLAKGKGQGPLRVVSLGGGPGNDALGFCSALVDLGFPESCGLDLTIVDPIPEWKVCVDVLKRLATQGGRFGDVSELFRRGNVNVTFECAEVPADPEECQACYDAIREADVVLMSKVVSILEWGEKGDLIEDVHSTMKDEALLLIIDCPLPINSYHWKTFRHLYNPLEEQLPYQLLETHNRFSCTDNVTSTAKISVMIKPRSPENSS